DRDTGLAQVGLRFERTLAPGSREFAIEGFHEALPLLGTRGGREFSGLREGFDLEINACELSHRTFMLPVLIEDVANVAEPVASGDTQPELHVLRVTESGIVAADIPDGFATHQDGSMHERTDAPEELFNQPFVTSERPKRAEGATNRVDHQGGRPEDRNLGMVIQIVRLSRQSLWEREVIRVLTSDVVPAG